MFKSLGQYDNAKEYLQKGLVIRIEIGDRKGEAIDCGNLGTVFWCLGQCEKAIEYFSKALNIRTEIGDKEGQAADLLNFGIMYRTVGDYEASEVCLKKALSICRGIGDGRKAFQILQENAILYLFQNKSKTLFCVFTCVLRSMRS